MGLFGLLAGWDQNKAANNAVLANHLLQQLGWKQKQDIAKLIVENMCRNRFAATDALDSLNRACRVTQMNFIALACSDLGIEPSIASSTWLPIPNPFSVGGHTKEEDISFSVRWYEKKSGVRINWPGDDLKVDFLTWYNGQPDAKPKSGEKLTATAR